MTFAPALFDPIIPALRALVGQKPVSDPTARRKFYEAAARGDSSRVLADEFDRRFGKQGERAARELLEAEFDTPPPSGFESDPGDLAENAKRQTAVRVRNFLRFRQVQGMSSQTAAALADKAVLGHDSILRRDPMHEGMMFGRDRNIGPTPILRGSGNATVLGWSDVLSRSEDSDHWSEWADEMLGQNHQDGWKGIIRNRGAAGAAKQWADQQGGHLTARLFEFIERVKGSFGTGYRAEQAEEFTRTIASAYAHALEDGTLHEFSRAAREMATAIDEGNLPVLSDIARARQGLGRRPSGAEWARLSEGLKQDTGEIGLRRRQAEWLRHVAQVADDIEDDRQNPDQPAGQPAAPAQERVQHVEHRDANRRMYDERPWGRGQTARQQQQDALARVREIQAMLSDKGFGAIEAAYPGTRAALVRRARELTAWAKIDFPEYEAENARRITEARTVAREAVARGEEPPLTVEVVHPITGRKVVLKHSDVFVERREAPAVPAAPPDVKGAVGKFVNPLPKRDRRTTAIELARAKANIDRLLKEVTGNIEIGAPFTRSLGEAADAERIYLEKQGTASDLSDAAKRQSAKIVFDRLGIQEGSLSSLRKLGEPKSALDIDFQAVAKSRNDDLLKDVGRALPTAPQIRQGIDEILKSGLDAGVPNPNEKGKLNVRQFVWVYNQYLAPILSIKTGSPTEFISSGAAVPEAPNPAPPGPQGAAPYRREDWITDVVPVPKGPPELQVSSVEGFLRQNRGKLMRAKPVLDNAGRIAHDGDTSLFGVCGAGPDGQDVCVTLNLRYRDVSAAELTRKDAAGQTVLNPAGTSARDVTESTILKAEGLAVRLLPREVPPGSDTSVESHNRWVAVVYMLKGGKIFNVNAELDQEFTNRHLLGKDYGGRYALPAEPPAEALRDSLGGGGADDRIDQWRTMPRDFGPRERTKLLPVPK